MTYLKRSATLLLFLLLLITIIVFAAATMYYQKSLTRLNDDIASRVGEINILTGEINSLTLNNSKLSDLVALHIKREENLTGQFSEIRTEKEKIEDEKDKVAGDLSITKNELFKAKQEIVSLESDLSDLEEEYKDLNQTYGAVLGDIRDVCEEPQNANLTDCEEYS